MKHVFFQSISLSLAVYVSLSLSLYVVREADVSQAGGILRVIVLTLVCCRHAGSLLHALSTVDAWRRFLSVEWHAPFGTVS